MHTIRLWLKPCSASNPSRCRIEMAYRFSPTETARSRQALSSASAQLWARDRLIQLSRTGGEHGVHATHDDTPGYIHFADTAVHSFEHPNP